jgi:hypothetical protein
MQSSQETCPSIIFDPIQNPIEEKYHTPRYMEEGSAWDGRRWMMTLGHIKVGGWNEVPSDI